MGRNEMRINLYANCWTTVLKKKINLIMRSLLECNDQLLEPHLIICLLQCTYIETLFLSNCMPLDYKPSPRFTWFPDCFFSPGVDSQVHVVPQANRLPSPAAVLGDLPSWSGTLSTLHSSVRSLCQSLPHLRFRLRVLSLSL